MEQEEVTKEPTSVKIGINQQQPEVVKSNSTTKEEADQDLYSLMIGYAKRYNGYNYISASRITCVPSDPKEHCALLKTMIFNHILRNGGDQKEFVDLVINNGLVIIQAHQDCPTLSKCGLYDTVGINGEPNKSRLCSYFFFNEKPEKFDPFIFVKQAKGQYGMIKGDPYFHLDADTQAMVSNELHKDDEKDDRPTV